jgi:bifunctional non-homologous end joining protein LigD
LSSIVSYPPACTYTLGLVSVTIKAGRRRVGISRPDKLLFPSGITKADLARYYYAVAEAMLPHLRDRPLNLERYPDGIEGERIVQQRAGRHFPGWIGRVEVRKKGGTVEHVVARNAATLVYLANQACITLHPWLSRRDAIDRPDRLIFDLDPSHHEPAQVLKAARTMTALLRELGLEPWVMSSGSRGYHLTLPLQRRLSFDEVRAFAVTVASLAARREPELFTTEQRKAKRQRRVLIDVMRNAYAHTAVAPYAVRPRPDAPVATPLHLQELDDPKTRPDRWTIKTVLRRLDPDGDPWAQISRKPQSISTARRRLKQAQSEVSG